MRRPAIAALVGLLLLWPLSFRYSSFGIDVEHRQGHVLQSTFYRLRWPGNGSVYLGSIRQQHRGETGNVEAIDLGGDFLKPAQHVPTRSVWNRWGFYWIDFDRSRDHQPPVLATHAQAVHLIGFPYWLLVLVTLVLALASRRRARAARRTGGADVTSRRRHQPTRGERESAAGGGSVPGRGGRGG